MILVDANMLLYATCQGFAEHPRASKWLTTVLRGPARVGLAWSTLRAFVRISTNARVFPRPLSADDAMDIVDSWLDVPVVWTPEATERHREVFGAMVRQPRAIANLVSDAELAALSVEHGLEICSTDADFSKFHGVRWRNPLSP